MTRGYRSWVEIEKDFFPDAWRKREKEKLYNATPEHIGKHLARKAIKKARDLIDPVPYRRVYLRKHSIH